MGRAGLLLVMGLGVAFGWISGNIRDSVGLLSEYQIGYYKYSYARNLARTALNRHLRFIDRNLSPPTSVTFGDGSYTVSAVAVGDTLFVTTRGMYADSVYTMRAKMLFTPKPFPTAKSAVGMSSDSSTLVIKGNAEINGNNHTAGGSLTGSGDLPGVTVSTTADSASIASSYDSTKIKGDVMVAVEEERLDPSAFISEYEAVADYTFGPGTHSGGTYGSAGNPVIVICNAVSDTVRFSGNMTGYGILAVRGSVVFSGVLRWYGLVMAYGAENSISMGSSGNVQILGGVMAVGSSVKLTINGTGAGAKVRYSSEALEDARRIGKLLYYSIIDWWE